jgi:hypothetical protein
VSTGIGFSSASTLPGGLPVPASPSASSILGGSYIAELLEF